MSNPAIVSVEVTLSNESSLAVNRRLADAANIINSDFPEEAEYMLDRMPEVISLIDYDNNTLGGFCISACGGEDISYGYLCLSDAEDEAGVVEKHLGVEEEFYEGTWLPVRLSRIAIDPPRYVADIVNDTRYSHSVGVPAPFAGTID